MLTQGLHLYGTAEHDPVAPDADGRQQPVVSIGPYVPCNLQLWAWLPDVVDAVRHAGCLQQPPEFGQACASKWLPWMDWCSRPLPPPDGKEWVGYCHGCNQYKPDALGTECQDCSDAYWHDLNAEYESPARWL